ncbi:TNT domain-containing protein [Actinomadura sp. WMMA1423]|uniref:TNT domain-containing protein n=1 Tax=Actinomadura sp. WMMA1423 TaxID=2591108 RepID=UPI0011463BD9|nr:TNT domain-containing protein [Actinomadura sp. WMMA1423]
MRVFKSGAVSAAILGLTVTLTGTAEAAGSGGVPSPRADACAAPLAASAREIIKQAEDCGRQPERQQAMPTTAQGFAQAAKDAGGRAKVCGPPYVKRDPRLGPVRLPRSGYFGFLLRGYDRYGDLSPSQFLYQYWDEGKVPPGWRYPPDDGFAHQLRDINSRPARFKTRLRSGQFIDRFGAETGRFLSPAGASFGSRALPPDSLNTRADDPEHLCNYHVYRVVRPFSVDGGPAEPAFQQPGRGLQYVLMGAYVRGAPTFLSVKWLVKKKYLRRIY